MVTRRPRPEASKTQPGLRREMTTQSTTTIGRTGEYGAHADPDQRVSKTQPGVRETTT